MYFAYGETECSYLRQKDKRLCAVIDRIGHIDRAVDTDLFSSVIHHIIGQQISTKAQATIWQRMQDALGDVVFINLPQEGDEVTAGESFGDVESVKAVSEILSPVSGVICAVNEDLADSPESLNSDPYGAWIIKVENVSETEELLDAAAYEAFCATEG